MSHWGTQTGYPGLRVEIAGPDAAMQGDRDYLVLGNANDQPAFGPLENSLPVTFDTNGFQVKDTPGYRGLLEALWRRLTGAAREGRVPSTADGLPDLMMEGIESPFFHGRSIVVMSLRNDDAVDNFADVFLERSQSSDIAHTVSLLRNGNFSSYAIDTPTYHVGSIAPYSMMRVWFAENFWILLLVLFGFSLVLAKYAKDYLALLTAQRLQLDPAQQTS
jgi:cellulose synthase (UDP-forming)